VNGHHTDIVLQQLMHKYIESFVLCPNCRLPETEYKIKSGVIFHKCAACGAKEMVDMTHKLCTYIIAQDKKAKAEAKKEGKKKDKKKEKKDGNSDDGDEDEKKKVRFPQFCFTAGIVPSHSFFIAYNSIAAILLIASFHRRRRRRNRRIKRKKRRTRKR
jgi:hypothetical protein